MAICIGCGARTHAGECAEGYSDVPLDLVDATDLQALSAATEARETCIAALQKLAHTLVAGGPVSWPTLRDRTRAALWLPAPEMPDIEVIQAWGCPRCGHIDAPQPPITPPASARGPTSPPSTAIGRPLRRDRLGGLVHEYVQAA